MNGKRRVIWLRRSVYDRLQGGDVTAQVFVVGNITVIVIYVNGVPVWEIHIGPNGRIIWQGPPNDRKPPPDGAAALASDPNKTIEAPRRPYRDYPESWPPTRPPWRPDWLGRPTVQVTDYQRPIRPEWQWPNHTMGSFGLDPTRVGGVRLNKAAQVIGDLGRITALTFNPESGQLVLMGDKGETGLPAMRLDDLAAVIYSIYVEGVDPTLSIDPKPGDLYGPKMDVVYSTGLRFTHAGGIMFLSDYKLKQYLADERRGICSRVHANAAAANTNGEQSPLANARESNGRIWWRFWLQPDDITLTLSPDGTSLVFDRARVRVKTENMIVKNGKLEPVRNVKDPEAEDFALDFTENYDEYAAESPVYHELKQLAQIVGLVKWMHQNGVEVDLNWVARHRPTSDITPLECDAVRAEVAVHDGSGTLAGESVRRFFGGAVLSFDLKARTLGEAASDATTVRDDGKNRQTMEQLRKVMQATRNATEQEAWETDSAATAVVVPGVPRQVLGAYRTQAVDLVVAAGGRQVVLERHYNSLFNEPTRFGRAWSLQLPRLLKRQPLGDEKRTVARTRDGQAKTLPVYVLSDDFGTLDVTFQPEEATTRGQPPRYFPKGRPDVSQLIASLDERSVRVLFRNRQVWEFDEHGFLVAKIQGTRRTHYVYEPVNERSQRLKQVVRADLRTQPLTVTLDYDGEGRIERAQGSDGSQTLYRYDDRGDLVAVIEPDGRSAYSYNLNHALVRVMRDYQTVESIAYDVEGRLAQIERQHGRAATYEYERVENGALRVTDKAAGRRLTYDAHSRLVSLEEPDSRTDYKYSQLDGRRQLATVTLSNSRQFELKYDELGRVIEIHE